MKPFVLCVVLAALAAPGAGAAEWENLNPGAGGRIIAITLDPNIDGRVFYLSDMEGVYRTENHGESWQYIGHDQRYSNSLFLAVEPGNSNRVYLGTTGGLHVSDSAGDNWRFARETDGDAIGSIAVSPLDPSIVYAAPGARGRYRELAREGVRVEGERDIYVSRDRGDTWQRVVYEPEPGLRECYSIQIDPRDGDVVYIGSSAGVYRSPDGGETWDEIPPPEGTSVGWGCALSPDGQTLYAAWQAASGERPPRSHIYATPTSATDWQILAGEGWDVADAGGLYWLNGPVLDPRSTPSEHKLLTANLTNLQGLYELTARWDGGRLADHSWQRILYYELDPRKPDLAPGFDHGWERYGCKPRTWQYAPLTWGRREIWSSLGQKLFAVNSELAGFTDRWEPKYTRFVGEVRMPDGVVRTYASRGVQCTYNDDMAAHRNYVVTCQGDNGIVESWDHGASWSIERRPNLWFSNASAACALLDEVDPPLVVAHEARGFGASGKNGSLQVKALRTHSPEDRFLRIAGGGDERAGMPFAQYRSIAVDPRDPKRVYAAAFQMGERWDTGRAAGVWLLRDVPAMLAAAGRPGDYSGPSGERITAGTQADEASFNAIFVDPLDSGVLWGTSDWTGRRGLWKATSRNGRWDWQFVMGRGQGASPDLAVWERGGRTCIALCWSPDDGAQHVMTLSIDGGRTWRTVLDPGDVVGLRPPSWLLPGEPLPHFTLMGPVGEGDRIYCTYFSFRHRKPLGLFRGIIGGDGKVMWGDFTDGLDFPVANRMKIIENEDARWLYVATRGTGCWRRRLGEAPRRAAEPEPVTAPPAGPVEQAPPPAEAPPESPHLGRLTDAVLWCMIAGGPEHGRTFTHPSRAVVAREGMLDIDLSRVGEMEMGVVSLPVRGLEAGARYTFTCEAAAAGTGGLIFTLPEPDPEGGTDADGRARARTAWHTVGPDWRAIAEDFTFTPGMAADKVGLFFGTESRGALVRLRRVALRPAAERDAADAGVPAAGQAPPAAAAPSSGGADAGGTADGPEAAAAGEPSAMLDGAELWCKTAGGPAYGQTFRHPSAALTVRDGVLTVDLTGVEPLQVAVLRLAAPGLEAGVRYTFSCEMSAQRPGGVILTLPEPHPDGTTDSAGKPACRPVWQGVRPQWRRVSETFTFTPGLASETVSVFFDARNAGAIVSIRNAAVRPGD